MDDPLPLVAAVCSGALLALGLAADTALAHYSHSKLERRGLDADRLSSIARILKPFDRLDLSVGLFNALMTIVFLGSVYLARQVVASNALGALGWAFGIYVFLLQGLLRAVVSRAAERVLLLLLGFIVVVDRLMAIVRVPIDVLGLAVSRSFGAGDDPTDADDAVEEILDAVAEGEAEGLIEEDAADFIENIMEYKDRIVREIMTPRTAMVCVAADTSIDAFLALVNEHGYSKIPVYEENRDNIVGILFLKDVIRHHVSGPRAEAPIRDLLRTPFFVPEAKKISDLLREFQQQKVQIAVVLDEFGGTSGLVTVEDIVEEIVGELEDEFDTETESEDVRRLDENNIEIDAKMTIDAVNEILSVAIPEDGDYETVGGFLSAKLGKVPEEGELFEMDGIAFCVTAADARRVERVRITTGVG